MLGGHSGRGGRDSTTGLRKFSSFSRHTFNQLHAKQEVLSSVFAFAELSQLNVNVDGNSEMAFGQVVSGDYFSGLGVQAERGRTIAASDDEAANPVAVISYRYWERRFKSDPEVVGKVIKVNGATFTIVGITPEEFMGSLQVGQSPDISVPLSVAPLVQPEWFNQPWFWWLRIMGRLKPGVGMERARTSLQPIFEQSALEGWNVQPAERRSSPEARQPRDTPQLRVAPGSRGLNEDRQNLRAQLGIFLVLLGVVLSIACANVANLLLARSAARQQEIVMRLAIGASRARLMRQLLSESILLALCAGAMGAVFAYWAKNLLMAWAPWQGDQFSLDLTINLHVLMFAIALSLATGILFGVMPALRATRIDLAPAMKEGARSLSRRRSFVSKTLLVGQIALSVVLLITAGLFVRTVQNLQNVNIGFNRENLLTFRVAPGANNYQNAQMSDLYRELIERIEAVPGVQSATASNMTMLSGGSWIGGRAYVRGQDFDSGAREGTYRLAIAPNFFDTLEIPLRLGRHINAQDNARAPRVAIVNESFVRRFFQTANPIGSYIGLGPPASAGELQVIGVVADAKYDRLRNTPMIVYTPYVQDLAVQDLGGQMTFEVRTAGDPNAFIPSIREAVRQVDANLPMMAVKTQSDQVAENISSERLFAAVAGSFGVVALLLACVGLYGILSYRVTRRTNEIGIRMALGAERSNVVGIVMRETVTLAGAGVTIGVVPVLVVARVFKGAPDDVLFGLTPSDPLTIFTVIGLMLAVAALAGYLPARRASRIDPTVALRYE